MCQKNERDKRTKVEQALFKCALDSLDVIYAHKAMATLLSTRLPEGIELERGYEQRGWCACASLSLVVCAWPCLALSRARSACLGTGATLSARRPS